MREYDAFPLRPSFRVRIGRETKQEKWDEASHCHKELIGLVLNRALWAQGSGFDNLIHSRLVIIS
ncbi:MAG: hypothetical protein WAT09_11385 [Paracoccaceae bacterium]